MHCQCRAIVWHCVWEWLWVISKRSPCLNVSRTYGQRRASKDTWSSISYETTSTSQTRSAAQTTSDLVFELSIPRSSNYEPIAIQNFHWQNFFHRQCFANVVQTSLSHFWLSNLLTEFAVSHHACKIRSYSALVINWKVAKYKFRH